MTTNKPVFNKTSIEDHIKNKSTKAEEAVKEVAPVTEEVAPKEAPETEEEATVTPKKRRNEAEWREILKYRDAHGLSSKETAKLYGVSVGSVDAWSSKLNKGNNNLSESLSTSAIMIPPALALLKKVTKDLVEFDAELEEAKALVADAETKRKAIESNKEEALDIIKKFGKQEDTDKALSLIAKLEEELRKTNKK